MDAPEVDRFVDAREQLDAEALMKAETAADPETESRDQMDTEEKSSKKEITEDSAVHEPEIEGVADVQASSLAIEDPNSAAAPSSTYPAAEDPSSAGVVIESQDEQEGISKTAASLAPNAADVNGGGVATTVHNGDVKGEGEPEGSLKAASSSLSSNRATDIGGDGVAPPARVGNPIPSGGGVTARSEGERRVEMPSVPPGKVADVMVSSTSGDGDDVQVIKTVEAPAEPVLSDSRKRSHYEIDLTERTAGTYGGESENRWSVDIDSSKEQKIDLNSTAHTSRWTEMFRRLAVYKDQYGDCLVPNRFPADPPLGHWVSSQRRQYKAMRCGAPGANAMTEERVKLLGSIGFEWETTDPRHVPWDIRYRELCEYVEEYGDAQVPMRWRKNIQLSNWVSKQRHDYKLRQRGTSGRLTDERYKLLTKIGFVWEAGKTDLKESTATKPPIRPLPPLDDAKTRQSNDTGRQPYNENGRQPYNQNGFTKHQAERNFATQQSAEHSRHANFPQTNEVQDFLEASVVSNPSMLLQAAHMNQVKLQLAGLFPAAAVGTRGPVAPGGLLTLPIPNSDRISFVPILHSLAQAPTQPHSMPQPPNIPPVQHMHRRPPGAGHTQEAARPSRMHHVRGGARGGMPMAHQQRARPASGGRNRGSDPPEG